MSESKRTEPDLILFGKITELSRVSAPNGRIVTQFLVEGGDEKNKFGSTVTFEEETDEEDFFSYVVSSTVGGSFKPQDVRVGLKRREDCNAKKFELNIAYDVCDVRPRIQGDIVIPVQGVHGLMSE